MRFLATQNRSNAAAYRDDSVWAGGQHRAAGQQRSRREDPALVLRDEVFRHQQGL